MLITREHIEHLKAHGWAHVGHRTIASYQCSELWDEVCDLALMGLSVAKPNDAVPTEESRIKALLAQSTKADQDRYTANYNKALRLRRVVTWANEDVMRAMYVEARLTSERTGIPHVVDHIVPFQGKTVSGLHVETNLQVITAAENQRKYNKFEE